MYLPVTTQHRAQGPGPSSPGTPPLQEGSYPTCVSTFPTHSLQKTGYQVQSKRRQELGAEVECWTVPRGHHSTGPLPCRLQSPD